MALKAEITDVEVRDEDGKMLVTARYFDDAQPTETIRNHTFDFNIGISNQNAKTAIQEYGTLLKARLAAKASKISEFVGDVLNIP
jgi:hypothetical protein